jgi:ABC-type transport system involved in cytochrome bd biosynthesis fused ATPase/permease subunit
VYELLANKGGTGLWALWLEAVVLCCVVCELGSSGGLVIYSGWLITANAIMVKTYEKKIVVA